MNCNTFKYAYLEIPPGGLIYVGDKLMYGVVIVEGRMTVELDSGTEINYFKFYNGSIEVTAPGGQKLKLNFLDDKDCDEILELVDVDNSGTVDWEELTEVLFALKPNLDNRNFSITLFNSSIVFFSCSR